jgi:hypothetical protein
MAANPVAIGERLWGDVELVEHVTGEPWRGLFRASARDGRTLLVSTSPPQRQPLVERAQALTWAHPQVAPLVRVDRVAEHIDALVEEQPAGEPLAARLSSGPQPLAALAPVIAATARVAAMGPAGGALRPELIYLRADALGAIAPRCDLFWRGARPSSLGAVMPFALQYQAPELWVGDDAPTPAADVFALALVLVHAVGGAHPFAAPTVAAQVSALLADTRPPLPPSLPPGLAKLLAAALARKPRKRPSLRELAEALDRI